MKRVLYDLTGLDAISDVLESLKSKYAFSIESREELANVDPEKGLDGKIVLFSDDYTPFRDKPDTEIGKALSPMTEYGLKLVYLAVPRDDDEFEHQLKTIGVSIHIVHDPTDEVITGILTSEFNAVWTTPPDIQEEEEEPRKNVASGMAVESESIRKSADTLEPTPTVTKEGGLCVIVSGAPGAGSTFVGLNLAAMLAPHVNYVEAGLRPCLTTWLGAENEEQTATLADPLTAAIEVGNLSVYTRNPFGEETVKLRQIAAEIATWKVPTVLDMNLQDYLASVEHSFADRTVRVLVTTADFHRCRYLEGISADVVAVNQVPTQLPIDEEEFRAFWPDTKLLFVPYEPEQGVAVVQGQPVVGFSDAILSAMKQVKEVVKGGEHVAAAV